MNRKVGHYYSRWDGSNPVLVSGSEPEVNDSSDIRQMSPIHILIHIPQSIFLFPFGATPVELVVSHADLFYFYTSLFHSHIWFLGKVYSTVWSLVRIRLKCLTDRPLLCLIVGVGLWGRGLWANLEGPHRLCAGHLLWPDRKTAGVMFSWHEHQTLGLSGVWVHPNNAW